MHNAEPEAIEAAAILHLLPVLANNSDVIMPTTLRTEVVTKFGLHKSARTCCRCWREAGEGGHLRSPRELKDVRGGGRRGSARISRRAGRHGSTNEVGLRRPVEPGVADNFTVGGDPVRRFKRTRLVVQVQLLYRMPIPFANWVIVKSYPGHEHALGADDARQDGTAEGPRRAR